ncbi:N-acetylmuramoyl-L-alanine amidase CwlD [Caldalkalibacillus mannanilyticus]|uniref:N-acetylmuramoyl-L-alanine amidase CwlD n=1 Tax=Caldalkalibacillus mannanilyticus TaxID=1418 RepID=UPI00046A45D4|nr:N-acetylmuramoyl-L-alanine amidase CwlD [Caldalkalibacillus mannanilyticus]
MRWNLKKMIMGGFAFAVLIYIFTTDQSYDFSRSAWSLPLTGKVIILDPGHGGADGGAISKQGLIEKEVTLAISIYLRDLLQQSGALVLMTRETDTDLADEESKRAGRRKVEDLKNRVKMINENNADLFISIHLNSIPSPKWRGAQSFFHPQFEESHQVSLFIQDELIRNLENTNRKAKKNQDIFILRHAEIPGSLVEVGFLSNAEESILLETAEYQKKVASSIYQGILRFYSGEKASPIQD